jgi:hypothetical protein
MSKITGFLAIILLSGTVVIGMDNDPYLFHKVPLDLKEHIVFNIINTDSRLNQLEPIINTIKNLASLDSELAQKLREPEFCLKIIKAIANRFNIPDFDVAKKLDTDGAKECLKKHNISFSGTERQLLEAENYDAFDRVITKFENFIKDKNVDLNFTKENGSVLVVEILKSIPNILKWNYLSGFDSSDRLKRHFDFLLERGYNPLTGIDLLQFNMPDVGLQRAQGMLNHYNEVVRNPYGVEPYVYQIKTLLQYIVDQFNKKIDEKK